VTCGLGCVGGTVHGASVGQVVLQCRQKPDSFSKQVCCMARRLLLLLLLPPLQLLMLMLFNMASFAAAGVWHLHPQQPIRVGQLECESDYPSQRWGIAGVAQPAAAAGQGTGKGRGCEFPVGV
jgi:hypothetical protein